MNKIVRQMLICLLWVVCVSTAYGQHTEDASVDTLKQSSREQQMQARLENYVQLLSTRKKPERPRVMVMPVMGFRTSQMSYGLMVAAMRRTGGYIKAKYSFSNTPSDDFECNDVGMSGEDGEVQWYTGKTEKSRLSVTGGIVQRLWKPFYLYAGVGYGTRTLVWETVGGKWGKNKDHSLEGVEAEIGGILSAGPMVFSLGLQRTALNIWREIWELELFFNR
ncbi:hypothetical protein [Parabacteroides goldsteinii]|uniref:hypothetical protein n=2 Tax=Parabacteroides goldsteinii TaxID=328812 RepID=UPI0025B1DDEA|nr:hypothetical protein [Parabacteroides goldsteinii]